MMPDLPNVDLERDLEQFVEFFENPAFRPDGLKIYPTLVIRGTGLYELWRTERYKSYPPSGSLQNSLFLNKKLSTNRLGCTSASSYPTMDESIQSSARYSHAISHLWSRARQS